MKTKRFERTANIDLDRDERPHRPDNPEKPEVPEKPDMPHMPKATGTEKEREDIYIEMKEDIYDG